VEFTLVQMWTQMGIVAKLVVIALMLMSVFTLATAVERLITYGRAERQSRAFAIAVKDLLAKAQFREASQAAEQYKGSHIAPVIRSGLTEYLQAQQINGGDKGYKVYEAVKDAIERSSLRQTASMRKGLAALATIGSTAPFVGLFGTTFGIINSFQGMAKEGGGGLGSVAAGIAEALMTTAVGIGVAIVAVLLYNYFTAKVEGLEVDAQESAGEVVALLAREHASH
jgi:biopolymer transport protein ExbB